MLNMTEAHYKDMGERTKKARKYLTDLDQEQMALALDVSRSAYAQYESGRTPMQSRHIPKFCEITGVTADWLLTGRGLMYKESATWAEKQAAGLENVRRDKQAIIEQLIKEFSE